MYPDEIDEKVYDSLIEAVHGGIGTLNEYLSIKKEQLGVPVLHMYDLYAQAENGFDIALDADAQGLAIASDLLPDERYTMNWETLLGMNLEEMTAGLLGTLEMQTAQTAAAISALEPLMEPYVAIVDEFMQELSVKEFYDVPEEYGFPAVAYEIYITCTHAQAAELLTRLADQLEGDGQLAPVLDVMLASQGLGSAAIVEMMRGAAGSLAQSEGHFGTGAPGRIMMRLPSRGTSLLPIRRRTARPMNGI